MSNYFKLVFIDLFEFNISINRKEFLASFLVFTIFFIVCIICTIKIFLVFNKDFIYSGEPLDKIKTHYYDWYLSWILVKSCLTFQFISLAIKRLNHLRASKAWVLPSAFVLIGFPEFLPILLVIFIYLLFFRFLYLIFFKNT